MTEPRFFLGYGERLTTRIPPPGGGGGVDPAYTFQEAVARLRPLVQAAVDTLLELPRAACPSDEAVGVVTLHPQWMSKTAHPQRLLDEYALRQVGSRPVTVQPEKWTRQPLPGAPLVGKIEIAATFCYATPTDPEDPGSYTRSGLGVTFRPHMQKFKPDATVPSSLPFFGKAALDTAHGLSPGRFASYIGVPPASRCDDQTLRLDVVLSPPASSR